MHNTCYVQVDYENKPVLINCSEKLQLTAQTEKRFAKEFLSRRTIINLRHMHTNTHATTNAHQHAHHYKCTPWHMYTSIPRHSLAIVLLNTCHLLHTFRLHR